MFSVEVFTFRIEVFSILNIRLPPVRLLVPWVRLAAVSLSTARLPIARTHNVGEGKALFS
jgi:hypothetical protein